MVENTTLPAFVKPTDPNFVSPEYIVPYTAHGVNLTAHDSHAKPEKRTLIWGQNDLMIDVITGARKMKLHPLSRLTEKIGGKVKFVPKELIEDMYGRDLSDLVEDDRWMNECPYFIVQQLIAWHIDVFGLIPKGLAEAIKSE